YEQTKSAEALGWLMLCYTGPVVVGGLIAGWLLDRFDRRWVILSDNLVRGVAVALIPLLNAVGRLELWHVYAVAAVYGFLMMISLAGGPALIPSLVSRDELATANALEMLSFTIGGVLGPALAGVFIGVIGAPNVVLVDAVSYFAFALALWFVRLPAEPMHPAASQTYGLQHAVRLLLGNRVLFSTTFMFMAANIGIGVLAVWLPILSDQELGGGSELYGTLLGLWALGEVVSSFVAGGRAFRLSLGMLICLAQILSGAAVGLMLVGPNVWTVGLGLILLGAFSAPLTIWAQTLRMQVIPERLRGRTFALLRMLMQSGGPVGSAVGGLALPLVGLPVMILASALVIGLPGAIGVQVSELRSGDVHDGVPAE
ncbi:MAG TPA: MFS transporter, partial [Anaerolineales bacterium]|nr:MFS transporter [Anaerolineales bacterium]